MRSKYPGASMALKSWLASLKSDVTAVTPVQAPIHTGLSCNGMKVPDVTSVTEMGRSAAVETSVTAAENQTLQPKPAWPLGCTLVTSVTAEIINTESRAANDPLLGDLLTGCNVAIAVGVTAATLAKFRAASLALDASIVAAGGSLVLPGERTTPTKTTTAQPGVTGQFRQRGPWLTGTEQSAAQDYHSHHFNCHTCIAKGRGTRYGKRCAVGLALWNTYRGVDRINKVN